MDVLKSGYFEKWIFEKVDLFNKWICIRLENGYFQKLIFFILILKKSGYFEKWIFFESGFFLYWYLSGYSENGYFLKMVFLKLDFDKVDISKRSIGENFRKVDIFADTVKPQFLIH